MRSVQPGMGKSRLVYGDRGDQAGRDGRAEINGAKLSLLKGVSTLLLDIFFYVVQSLPSPPT